MSGVRIVGESGRTILLEPEWEATITLTLGAGAHVQQIADDVAAFFSEPSGS